MKPLIVGNWKMNGSGSLLDAFLMSPALTAHKASQIILCPPVIYLSQGRYSNDHILLGAQDCAPNAKGAYTGDISAPMLAELGVRFTLVGHSERRHYHRETNDQCAAKVLAAQASGLTPIFCVGETRKDYLAGNASDVVVSQLESLSVHGIDFSNLVVTYEPQWSVGSGVVPELYEITDMLNHIRRWLVAEAGFATGNRTKLLYGGSVTDENAKAILGLEPVGGVLVGGASLDVRRFAAIASTA